MRRARRLAMLKGLTTVAALGVGRLASAQAKVLTVIVGFAPGGATDVVARLLAERLSTRLDRHVLVDNRPGAGGQIAMSVLKQLPADGNTVVLTPPPALTIFPTLYPKLPYDARSDFVPVTTACTFEHALAVGPATPAASVAEFIAWCKANPTKANLGVPNLGSAPHFLTWLLGRDTGLALEAIGYRGGGPPMVQDLVSGQIPASISVLSNFMEFHRAGKLRILATSGAQRSALLPEVPTLVSLGYRNAQVEEWFAFFARAGTPAPALERFTAAVREVLEERAVHAALIAQAFTPRASGQAELAALVEADSRRWARVIAESGFKAAG